MPRRLNVRVLRSAVLQVAAVLAAFVAALVLWAGGTIGDGPIPGASGLPPGGARFVPTQAPVRGAGSVSPSGHGPAAPGELGRHTVTLAATSDAAINAVSYKVKGASPAHRTYKAVAPPFSVTVVAHGEGTLVAFGVQAGPDASMLRISLAVDGQVRCTRAVKGAYAVAVCYG